MLLLFFSVVLVAGAAAFTLFIRPSDLPKPEPVLPWQHLEDRRARIYENLRDLQFEYRVGKLSDEDYQHTKQGLQKELAATLAEMDTLKSKTPAEAKRPKAAPPKTQAKEYVCPHCNARFEKHMKFCGECGKAMQA